MSMSTWWIIAIVLGVLLAGVLLLVSGLRRRQAPRVRTIRQDEVGAYLELLLRRGYDAGVVALTLPDDERFVSVTKYYRSTEDTGLELDFPRAAWSERYYPGVRALLDRERHPGEVVKTPGGPVEEYLRVDCGRDVALATMLVLAILREVFGIPEGQAIVAELQQVAISDDMVSAG